MKIKHIMILLISCTLIFCTDKKEQKSVEIVKIGVPEYVKTNNNDKLTDSLVKLAIFKGDEKAYNELASNYILDANYEELLYYSTIMANKYNNPEANFHIFLVLSKSNNGKAFEELDIRTKNLALFHLVKSNELGYESAIFSINEIFDKNNKVQKSNYYLTLYGSR